MTFDNLVSNLAGETEITLEDVKNFLSVATGIDALENQVKEIPTLSEEEQKDRVSFLVGYFL